jgi:hypothetical protein
VDGHPHPEGEGGFPVPEGLAAVGVVGVGGDAEVGVEPVEGLLGVADGVALEVRVGVAELVGEAVVVVAVAGGQATAEAVGDLVDRPVAELMAAPGGRGLQVVQQFGATLEGVAVLFLAEVFADGTVGAENLGPLDRGRGAAWTIIRGCRRPWRGWTSLKRSRGALASCWPSTPNTTRGTNSAWELSVTR